MFFINLIFALVPILGFSADLPATAEQEEYCNERFNFCVTYPNNYFTEKTYADNGDGVVMATADSRVELDVMGAYNVMNWSVQDIIDSYFKSIKNKPMEVELSELKTEASKGSAKMTYNYEIQLFQVNMLGDTYITTIITVPASEPELLNDLVNKIQVAFPT
ncbi:MAG: hypothetical protein KDD04_06795 [Sinomicrobium sp.]|nr:hypothetical protein [Sinomicrobium sp.]